MTLAIKEKLEIFNAEQKALSLIQKLWEYIVLISQQLKNEPAFIQSLTISIDSDMLRITTHKTTDSEGNILITVQHPEDEEHHSICTDKTQDEMISELTVFSSRLLFGKTISLEGEYLSDTGKLNGFGTVFWRDFLTANSNELRRIVSYRNRESLNSDINNTYLFGIRPSHSLSA